MSRDDDICMMIFSFRPPRQEKKINEKRTKERGGAGQENGRTIFTFKTHENLFNDGLVFMEDAFVVSEEADMMIEAGALLTESEHVRPCMSGG